jgi:hypothetical protein
MGSKMNFKSKRSAEKLQEIYFKPNPHNPTSKNTLFSPKAKNPRTEAIANHLM